MKVAIIAPSQIPARRANTLQVMKMAQAIAEAGHEARLVAPILEGGKAIQRPSWEELSRHYGLRTGFALEWLPARPFWRRYDFGYRAVAWARGWSAEMIYTRLPQAAAIASQVGVPTILETHDMPQGVLGPLLFKAFLAGRGAQRLVVITHRLLNELRQRFGAQLNPPFVLVEPDGVDLWRYADLPDAPQARRMIEDKLNYKLESSRFMAGYTGHFYPGRGADLILEIAGRLPQMTFLLVGGEPQDVHRLAGQIRQKALSNVVLSGFVPNAELPLYQAACDALLMPYQRRVAASSGGDIASFLSPMKLFEYLACGRAILSSDLPVLKEILSPECAVLLPPDEVGKWVEALSDLEAHPDRRAQLGERARSIAVHYTWEARAQRILEGLTDEYA